MILAFQNFLDLDSIEKPIYQGNNFMFLDFLNVDDPLAYTHEFTVDEYRHCDDW